MKFERAFFLLFSAIFKKKCLFPVFLIIYAYLTSFFYLFIVFSCKVFFDRIKIKINSNLRRHVVCRRPRHRCRVNKDIPTLKIELSVIRQNDQGQREQFTFYFSEKSLRNP
jgi:hypothetical protein